MVADTFSPNLGLIQMGTGNDNNTWGVNLNAALLRAEKGIAGFVNHAVTGGTLDLSADPTLGSPVALEAIQNFTGVLGSNQIVTIPNASRLWYVDNQTTGAFTLTFKTTAGSASAAIPQGGQTWVWCNGSNVVTLGIPTTYATVQFQGGNGVVGAPFYSFLSETTSGIYRKSAGIFAFSVGGVEIFDWDASGVNLIAGTYRTGGSQLIPPGVEWHYAGVELPVGGWVFCDGSAYGRVAQANLFAAITKTATANVQNGSPTLSSLSADLRFKGLLGAFVEGTGIPTNTTITAVAATTLTMSQNANATNNGVTIRLLPYGQGDASTTFNVPNRKGLVVAGRDDMGGSAQGNLTTPVDGTRLNAIGGSQTHTLSIGEIPSHNHGVNDPTHTHTATTTAAIGTGGAQGGAGASQTDGTGTVTVNAASTGISIQSNGGGGAHNNVQPTAISNMIIKL